jgi:hypothetical protein
MDFLFSNVYLDIERWLERYGPDTPRDKEVRQVGKYGKAERIVLDAYYEAKAYKALVAHELGMNVVVGFESPKLHRLSDALVNDNEAKHLVRLWRGIIAKRKMEYWTCWSYRNKIPDYSAQVQAARRHVIEGYRTYLAALVQDYSAQVQAARRHVIEGYRTYLAALVQLDEQATLEQVRQELAHFESGQVKKLTSKPDPRQIDEELFWRLLGEAGDGAETVEAQAELLVSRLETFRGPQIRRFQTLLYKQMRRAYHWNVWALASIAQDGCSDDAFEEFRAWLILQGNDLLELAVHRPAQAMHYVPKGLGTYANVLLQAPAIAYEKRTGKPLVPPTDIEAEPRGEPWEEEELQARYPPLWRYYGRSSR